jgi:hypothetical protein
LEVFNRPSKMMRRDATMLRAVLLVHSGLAAAATACLPAVLPVDLADAV